MANEAVNDAPSGVVLTFGSGDMGQLGLGDEPKYLTRKKPFFVPALRDKAVVSVSAGALHCLAVGADGSLYSWGCNDDGVLGRAGDEYNAGVVDLDGDVVVAADCGDSHSLAVTEDGAVLTWGTYKDNNGVVGHSKGVAKQPVPTEVSGVSNVVQASCGDNHDLAITRTGKVYEWGDRLRPRQSFRKSTKQGKLAAVQVRLPRSVKATAVFAGGYSSFAVTHLRSDESQQCVFFWGLNNYGQAGLGYESKEPIYAPMRLEFFDDKPLKQISAGLHHTVFLTTDGRVYACGRGAYGRLGLGNEDNQFSPVEVTGFNMHLEPGDRIAHIDTSAALSLAVSQNGQLFTFGYGDTFALGNAQESDELSPYLVTGSRLTHPVLHAAVGSQHTVFVMKDPDA